jgi:predicted membrane protein
MTTKTKNIILAIIITIVAIFLPAFILNKWIEAIFFFFCHWLIREQFPKQYHHIIPAMCRLISSVVFFFGVCFVLPSTISVLSAIPICYFISWVGFTKKQADDFEVKYLRLKAKLDENKEFNTDTCTLKELIARCEELHFSEENTNLCVEFFIKKTKNSEIAKSLCVESATVNTYKWRLKQKLNKK